MKYILILLFSLVTITVATEKGFNNTYRHVVGLKISVKVGDYINGGSTEYYGISYRYYFSKKEKGISQYVALGTLFSLDPSWVPYWEYGLSFRIIGRKWEPQVGVRNSFNVATAYREYPSDHNSNNSSVDHYDVNPFLLHTEFAVVLTPLNFRTRKGNVYSFLNGSIGCNVSTVENDPSPLSLMIEFEILRFLIRF